MAVKDFLSIDDAKQTVEKPVHEKPKPSDLVTVESPGKPTPALQLESKKRKTKVKKKKAKKAKAPAKNITSKDYTLIITEKPQSAQKIAAAIGPGNKITEGKVSYYEIPQKKILIASAVGHLFNLTYNKGSKGFPIFDLQWQPSHLGKAAFTKPYFQLLKQLSSRARDFIIATDYDIEGEVIGWNILRFICNKQDARRMKYSTLTSQELQTSFQKLEHTLNFGNAYAGEARHILDWIYGINLSRALMSAIKTSGSFKILSIGRVQGPALKIIVDREKAIQKFKPEPYWNVYALSNNLKFKHPKDIFNKKDLEPFKKIKEAEAETTSKTESTQPPVPFDLTTLQREAYRLHKYSPSMTLQVAQKLYLSGLISYPRTSSQKIPDSIKPLSILKKLSKAFPEASSITRKKPVEGKKSDPAHPSIYPTGDLGKMTDQENKLYNLIVKRFVSCFYPDLVTENKRIVLTANKLKFTLSGLQILEKGWTKIYPTTIEEKSLPDLSGKVKVDKIVFDQKETKPPQRYTPTGLVSLLEKKNLGTKATRSNIVDTLFDRGYLDGKSIQATPLGMKLIEALEKYSSIIIDENLTKQLEEEMLTIQDSQSNFKSQEEKLIEKTKSIITDIAKEFKTHESKIGQEISSAISDQRKKEQESNILMPCPSCKQGNLRILYSKKFKSYFVGCSNYPNCKQTYSLPPNALIKNTGEKNEKGQPLLLSIKKGKKPWKFPFNPNWKNEKDQSPS